MGLLDTLRRTLAERGLIAPGDRVLVAVSGGPDSLALLHALHSLQDELGLADLRAAHLDHGLRGAEAAAEAQFVADWCAGRGIPCTIGVADIAAQKAARGGSTQEAARAVRYAFLEETARAVGADKIATGHTQDDQIETALLNILRGTGLDGLRGIPYARGPFVRPLLDVPRTSVEAYCAEQGLAPRRDPSNSDPSHYTRNKLRLELLPVLERDYNPAVRAALLRLSENAARDADFLHAEARAALPALTLARTERELVLDARGLRLLHPSLQRHVLRAAFAHLRGTTLGLTHEHLGPLCAALAGERRLPFGLTTPPPHCAARVTQRRLTLRTQELTTIPAATGAADSP
ncbi:MAG: tRNA lysidine(34) synthetase TilS [Armatimonadetes bacterium]|nr:tRNA lysidine(34) synthetase TilS [Armatimonadota bacterium]